MKNQIETKLRVVTRKDLTIGQQSTQGCHAAIDFQHQHPIESKIWHNNSNYLILLTVANEQKLYELISKAILRGIKHTIFREPDLNNEITAVAFDATEDARKLTSSCPLLGKEVVYA